MSNILINLLNNNWIQKPLLGYKNILPRIAYYHIVSDTVDIPYYYKKNIFNTIEFKNQLKWFVKNGYKFVSMDEAIYLAENNENATKTIAFTTDDGFKENYDIIAPILAEFKIGATLFLISNCLDNNNLMWVNKINFIKNKISLQKEVEICNKLSTKYNLSEWSKSIIQFSNTWPMSLKDDIADYAWKLSDLPTLAEFLEENSPYITNNQIEELLGKGYILGSHSVSHPDFSKLSEEETMQEMIDSKVLIENTFGIEVKYFAYPYGKRPSKFIEQEVVNRGIYKKYFGTKSNLTNTKENDFWERDKMEQSKAVSRFWFTVIPVIRNTVLHPLGKYK